MKFVLFLFFLVVPTFAQSENIRPEKWAKPLTLQGVSNFYEVNKSLYRASQPTRLGFENLKKMGIKTIVDLRVFHSDSDLISNLGFNYYPISFKAWHPEDEDVASFLKIVSDKKNYPILVHCEHGADRTGMMIAIYRITKQGWSNKDAADEMVNGGYGFHSLWENIIRFVEDYKITHLTQF